MLIAFTLALIMGVIYSAYIYYIGIPMTEARNKFNKAQLAFEVKDCQQAKVMVEESLKLWQTDDALSLKKQINCGAILGN